MTVGRPCHPCPQHADSVLQQSAAGASMLSVASPTGLRQARLCLSRSCTARVLLPRSTASSARWSASGLCVAAGRPCLPCPQREQGVRRSRSAACSTLWADGCKRLSRPSRSVSTRRSTAGSACRQCRQRAAASRQRPRGIWSTPWAARGAVGRCRLQLSASTQATAGGGSCLRCSHHDPPLLPVRFRKSSTWLVALMARTAWTCASASTRSRATGRRWRRCPRRAWAGRPP
mmetsp:Transcript_107505/g.314316  ORF Transcript_107505/g.314316 Transcript_107505/m.314316 type:complete len:232 (-) Transcript_107505:267-962(-)